MLISERLYSLLIVFFHSSSDLLLILTHTFEDDWPTHSLLLFPENTFSSLVVLNGRLTRLSIMLKLNSDAKEDTVTPSPSRSSSHESIPETYCSLSSMTSGKCAMGCISFNGCILVCGAYSRSDLGSALRCRITVPIVSRCSSTTGGYDRVECLKTVEKYHPDENVWKLLPTMLEARGRVGICASKNIIYAVGGSNGSTELSTVECYDPEKEKWSRGAPLPAAKSNAGRVFLMS